MAVARVALVVVAYLTESQASVTLSNVDLRYTVEGSLVNAHSGGLYRFNDTFYLDGTAYENCTQEGPVCTVPCGSYNNVFVAYSSPDLVEWRLISDNLVPAINSDSASVEYDEVNVGFCAARGDFVLTYWSGHYGFANSKIAVARADSPSGPFTPADPIVAQGGAVISDTVGLFVDDDGTAYVRYNTKDAPLRHVVERLNTNWTASTGDYGVIFSKQDFPWYDGKLASGAYYPAFRVSTIFLANEGGGMFKRDGIYYVMLSFDCCCESKSATFMQLNRASLLVRMCPSLSMGK